MSAASKTLPSWLPASVMAAAPDLPLARPMTVSLVLVSPSTVICTVHNTAPRTQECDASRYYPCLESLEGATKPACGALPCPLRSCLLAP